MSKYDRDSDDVYAVKRLGDEIGYGHLMALAHELWARHLESKGLPRTGAHVVVGFPMVKDEYQADAIRDQIYTIIVSKALDEADTPQTDSEITRNSLRTDCTGCKFVGWYDTEFPCVNCIRKNKDYYTSEQTDCAWARG